MDDAERLDSRKRRQVSVYLPHTNRPRGRRCEVNAICNALAVKCDLSTIIVLIQVSDGDNYTSTPLGIASSTQEMDELCTSHFVRLNPNEDVCPDLYEGFARDCDGNFQSVIEIHP